MRIPFLQRRELPSDTEPDSFTEAVIKSLENESSGEIARYSIHNTAAVEAASGIIARALSMGTIKPNDERTAALTPETLKIAGRELIRTGEVLFLLEVSGGVVSAVPVAHWDVKGSKANPSTWKYRVDVPTPDSTLSKRVPASQVIHWKWAVDPRSPWRGISPLSGGTNTTQMLGRLEGGLHDEVKVPTGNALPMSATPTQRLDLQKILDNIRGRAKIVSSEEQGWGASGGSQTQSRGGWKTERIGPNPPAALVDLRNAATLDIFGACGIPPELASSPEGSASREAWRRFLHGTLQPVADSMAHEATQKLNVELSISFDRLFASDISGRARAFQSMAKAGLPIEKAAALSGLLEDES